MSCACRNLHDITFLGCDAKATRKGVMNMTNKRQTSKKVASKASKQLNSPKATPAQKSVAASALSQTKSGKTKKK